MKLPNRDTTAMPFGVVFKTLSNIYYRGFLRKQLTTFNRWHFQVTNNKKVTKQTQLRLF